MDEIARELANELAPLGYEVGSLLASSNHASLFKARQVNLQRDVAIKVLTASALQSDVAEQRFQREAKLLASFEHPNVVKLYGVGKLADGRAYMVMEFIQGASLAVVARSTPLTEGQIRSFASQICSALAYAHEKNIVHRDLKPGNVMLHQSDSAQAAIKLIDFGIYKDKEGASQNLTSEGSIPGTANYMSPEQCKVEALDGRSDLYSLGCILYEFCVGQPPMQADTDWLTMSNQLNKEIKHVPASIEVSDQLKQIILRCLEKDPARRYQSAAELKADLDKKSKSDSISVFGSKKNLSIAASLVLLALAAFAVSEQFSRSGAFQSSSSDDAFSGSRNGSERTSAKGAGQGAKGAGKSSFASGEPPKSIEQMRLRLRYDPFYAMYINDNETQGRYAARQWLVYHLQNDPRLGLKDLHKSWGDGGGPEWDDLEVANKIHDHVEAQLGRLKAAKSSMEEALYAEQLFLALDLKQRTELRLAKWSEYLQTIDTIVHDPDIQQYFASDSREILFSSFLAFKEKGDYAQAQEIYRIYLPQIQLPEYKAKFMILMGDLAHKRTGVKEAAPYFNSAYETFKSVKAVSDWTILWILCIRLNMIDQYEKVCHLAERFPLQASLAHTDNTRLFSQYARAMMELGLYKKAEILMSSPVVCKLCKEEKNFQFQVLAWRIQVATQQKDKELVRKRLLEILDQIEPNNDEHLFVNLAIGEACERYPEFFQLCDQKLKDRAPLLLAILYANKAHYLRSKLNYLQALADYRSSHFYFDKTGKRYYPGRINVFSGEADTYIYLKEFEKARECLKLGTRYIDSSEKSDLKFSLRSMEGNLLREEGKNEEALRLHKELLEQIVRNGYSSAPMFGNVIGQIALDYKAMGQYDAAILVVEQSLPQIRAANIFSAEVARGVEKELTNIKELKAQREKRRAQK